MQGNVLLKSEQFAGLANRFLLCVDIGYWSGELPTGMGGSQVRLDKSASEA